MNTWHNVQLLLLLCEAIFIAKAVILTWANESNLLLLLVLAFFFLIIPAWVATIFTIKTTEYLFKGYAVYTYGHIPEPPVTYKERKNGKIEFDMSLKSDGDGRFFLVQIPSNTAWDREVPSWAIGRRSEIVTRIKKELSWDKSIRVED